MSPFGPVFQPLLMSPLGRAEDAQTHLYVLIKVGVPTLMTRIYLKFPVWEFAPFEPDNNTDPRMLHYGADPKIFDCGADPCYYTRVA